MAKYSVTMVVRGIVEADEEMKLWRHDFSLTDISHSEILDVEEVNHSNPQTKLEKKCHHCDWPERYDDDYSNVCENCSRHLDDCTCCDIEDQPLNEDCIFDEIDDWLLRGHFDLCSRYLKNISVDKLSTAKLLLILTATLPASTNLSERPGFYDRVYNALRLRGEDVNALLSGLDGVKMKEPLPCPFCGGEVAPYEIPSTRQYYIQCYNDNCKVNPAINRPSGSEEDVISRWNKRKEKS